MSRGLFACSSDRSRMTLGNIAVAFPMMHLLYSFTLVDVVFARLQLHFLACLSLSCVTPALDGACQSGRHLKRGASAAGGWTMA